MPSTIYNEGRVVGFSAYEIYVRHALSEDPETPPASELEWLASSIATGSSMLLKISADLTQSGHHIINVPLPEDSNLSAANTIIGSLFLGDAEVGSDSWATKVTSYGPLIENNATNPSTGDHSADTTIPPTTYTSPLSAEYQDRILNYIKILDGIVVQPGSWSANDQSKRPPYKDFSPDLGKRPFVKIYLSDTVTEDFYVLLTGFTLRTVLAGVSGLDGSTDTDTNYPANGGFLGPAVFPWANKIVFSVPPAYAAYFLNTKYSRKMSRNGNPASVESAAKDVRRVSVIDMETTDPAAYYADEDSDCRVAIDVIDINNINGDAVLTVYQRNLAFPPALFGAKFDATGAQHVHPIDTVAPGTVKFFDGENRAALADKSILFEDQIPNNHALFRDSNDYVVRQINHSISSDPSDWIDTPVADTYATSLYGTLESSDVTPPYFVIQTNAGDPAGFAATTTLCNRRVRGKVSDQFRQDFGIDPATAEGYGFLELLTQRINNSYDHGQVAIYDSQINMSMVDYISNIPDWKSKYFFIVQASSPRQSGTSIVSNLTLVPVAKPNADDIAPSNTFDYIYKSYGPSFKIPIILPTSADEANRAGSSGQYVGGYYNREGPTSHITVMEYLQTVLHINPVALMDYARRVPQIDGCFDWQDAYAAITVAKLVAAVREDAVERGIIPASVTVDTILNGGFQYTYTDTQGNSRTTTYQKINSQYWDMPLSEALETAVFYDATTGDLIDGNIQKLNYVYINDLQLIINDVAVNYSNYIDTLGNIPDWSDNEDLRFELTTSQPADWETSWKRYFTRSINTSTQRPRYDKVAGSSAPTWDYNTYYIQKYEFTSVSYSQSLTLTTAVQQNAPKFVAMQWPTAEAQNRYSFRSGPLSAVTTTGLHQTKSLSVADSEGKMYDMSGESGTISNLKDGNIHWDDLLNALVNNKAIDVLGSNRFISELYQKLLLMLLAGNGIDITEAGDPDYTKTLNVLLSAYDSLDPANNPYPGLYFNSRKLAAKVNESKGMAINNDGLYVNFAPDERQGVGINISVDPSSHEVIITNTMPDYTNSNYTLLRYGSDKDYTINAPNRFTVDQNKIAVYAAASGDKKTVAIKVMFATNSQGIHAGNSNFGEKCFIHENSDGTAEFSINNGGTGWHQSTYNGTHNQDGTINRNNALGVFAFKHTLSTDTACLKSNIVNIKFTSSCIENLFKATTDGTDRRSKYRFEDTSGPTSGIWNIANADRASWSASCGLRGNREYYNDGNLFKKTAFTMTTSDITVIGFSYSDGYNAQFPTRYTPTDSSSPISSDHINLEVSGVFRYRG